MSGTGPSLGATPPSLMISDVVAALPESPWRDFVIACLLLGFGLKVGLVPGHVWMPLVYSELQRLAVWIEDWTARDLSADLSFAVQVCLEEAVVNIMMYSAAQDDPLEIAVEVERTDQALVARIVDNGSAFDPTRAPRRTLPASLAQAKVGNLGIHLMRSFAGDMRYERRGNRNRLTMRFVEATRFRGYSAAGVNRVSLGVQALDDAALKELGRLHSAQEALAAVAVARANFERFSFDLIYARPGQTPAAWRAELERAIAQAGEHLSLYQLTIEQETPFAALHAAGKLVTPDDDAARALYDTTQEVCAAAGLPAYEISNHARPGAECRHNLIYWRAHEYAGIGPGAHGRLDIAGARRATATEKRPESWLMRVESLGHGVVTDEALTREQVADEFLLMGLRLAEGIDPARYARLAGRPLDPRRIALLREQGAVETTASGRLRLTLAGFPVLDAVVADLAA